MMVPVTPSANVRKSSSFEEPVRRYRHDPYGIRVLASPPVVSPAAAAASSASTSISAALTAFTTEAIEEAKTITLPNVHSKNPVVYISIVAFKYGTKEFHTPFPVHVGEAVITEGDRGEDLGFVQRVDALPTLPAYIEERVLRMATPEDLQAHYARVKKEEEALHTMCMLARQVKCPAFIQDIMYQLDGRKITVIIARDSRSYVDFRRLQRAAFDVFRCRVWCAYLDEITVPQVGGVTTSPPPQRPFHGRRSRCLVMLSNTREVGAQV